MGDKGYHKASTLELASEPKLRTYIPEPKRKYRHRWIATRPVNKRGCTRIAAGCEASEATDCRGSERVERSFAHICETGGARRALLCGQEKVSKRYLIQAAARNLGLMLRKLFGVGTAKSLQGLTGACARLAALHSWPRMPTFSYNNDVDMASSRYGRNFKSANHVYLFQDSRRSIRTSLTLFAFASKCQRGQFD